MRLRIVTCSLKTWPPSWVVDCWYPKTGQPHHRKLKKEAQVTGIDHKNRFGVKKGGNLYCFDISGTEYISKWICLEKEPDRNIFPKTLETPNSAEKEDENRVYLRWAVTQNDRKHTASWRFSAKAPIGYSTCSQNESVLIWIGVSLILMRVIARVRLPIFKYKGHFWPPTFLLFSSTSTFFCMHPICTTITVCLRPSLHLQYIFIIIS
jgi:hypothetical protein